VLRALEDEGFCLTLTPKEREDRLPHEPDPSQEMANRSEGLWISNAHRQRARVDAGLGDTDDTKTAGSDIGTIRKERMVARAKLNSYGEFR
jgi:hypothetical protein